MNKIILYTLPSCGICHMAATKLKIKDIPFEQRDFSEIAEAIHSDHAPALEIIDEHGNTTIYNSPSEIVDWINTYGR